MNILKVVSSCQLKARYIYSNLVKKLLSCFVVVVTSSIALTLQGCFVAAVGAGIGAVKYGNARKQEVAVECRKAYNDYVKQMGKNDSDEETMTLEEYCE